MNQFQHLHLQIQMLSVDNTQYVDRLLEYAVLCKDEEVIYDFMENKRIGQQHSTFWINRFRLNKRKGNLEQAYEYLKVARSIIRKSTDQMMTISKEEGEIKKWLKKVLREEGKYENRILFDLVYYDNFTKQAYEKKSIIETYDSNSNKKIKSINQIDVLIKHYNQMCSIRKSILNDIYNRQMNQRPESCIRKLSQNQGRQKYMSSMNQRQNNNCENKQRNFESPPSFQKTPKRTPIHDPQQSSVKILRRTSFINPSKLNNSHNKASFNNLQDSVQRFRDNNNLNFNDYTFGKQPKTPCFKQQSSINRASRFTLFQKSEIHNQILSSMKKLNYSKLQDNQQNMQFFTINKLVQQHIINYPNSYDELDGILNESNLQDGIFSLSLRNKQGGMQLQLKKKEYN